MALEMKRMSLAATAHLTSRSHVVPGRRRAGTRAATRRPSPAPGRGPERFHGAVGDLARASASAGQSSIPTARHTPLPVGALPQTDDLLARTFTVPVWAAPAPALADQYVLAFQKVAAHMAELATYQARQRETTGETETRELAAAGQH